MKDTIFIDFDGVVRLWTGGGWGNRATQGAWAEAQRGEIPTAISRVHQNGTV